MAQITADCPRCGAGRTTFDIEAEKHLRTEGDWRFWYEIPSLCRTCFKFTIFIIAQKSIYSSDSIHDSGIVIIKGSINHLFNIEGYVNISDVYYSDPPKYLPEDVCQVYVEGARCKSIGCWNAAATMFRAALDITTQTLLPDKGDKNPNAHTRRNLGFRLAWLFDNGHLPEAHRELSNCIREDGNDGAHMVNLSEGDAEDILEFTHILLERIYTEPAQLRLAKERRDSRRATE